MKIAESNCSCPHILIKGIFHTTYASICFSLILFCLALSIRKLFVALQSFVRDLHTLNVHKEANWQGPVFMTRSHCAKLPRSLFLLLPLL